MNPIENKTSTASVNEIDASLRVPLLALFGGAALWLVVGLLLGILAGLTFHKADFMSGCSVLTYGHLVAAANDAVLYGFAIPAALGVALWIFARLSGMPLALPIVPVVAANLWHLGILVGLIGILMGESTGYAWLEFPRAAAVILFGAFLLIAVSGAATFGWRTERELYPAHWFLFGALLWFVWTYSTGNLFLTAVHVPRGVVQSIIGWWFANNLLFVWITLTGMGIAFYFLPKLGGRPLPNSGLVLFAFLSLIFFGTWCGIPVGAPVPAWLPTVSTYASLLTVLPVIAIAITNRRTFCGVKVDCHGGPFCFIRFGVVSFVVSSILYLLPACPHMGRLLQFTWFGVAQSQLQVLGFFAMVILGATYYILPRVMNMELPFPKFAKLHYFLSIFGVLLLVIPLIIAGVEQGIHLQNPNISIAAANESTAMYLKICTLGQLLLLIGALLFALNIFVMTIKWKMALVKTVFSAVTAPLPESEVKA